MNHSTRPTVLALIGSATPDSSNHALVAHLKALAGTSLGLELHPDLACLPHFDPRRTLDEVPVEVIRLRQLIDAADAVLIATPEYIFSIPSRLKNALEWCVATTIFTDKPVALITASASGLKGHAELQLIMKTLGASFSDDTCLLIQGVKGKVADDGTVTDPATGAALKQLLAHLSGAIVS